MFLYSKWLALPLSKRAELAARFGIAKVRPTHVFNNEIADDGYNVKDVEHHISTEKIQALFETKEQDPDVLWDMLLNGQPEVKPAPVETPPVKVATKRGRPAKKNVK